MSLEFLYLLAKCRSIWFDISQPVLLLTCTKSRIPLHIYIYIYIYLIFVIKKVAFIFSIISKAPERSMRLQETVWIRSYKVEVLYKNQLDKNLGKMCSQFESDELSSFYVFLQT